MPKNATSRSFKPGRLLVIMNIYGKRGCTPMAVPFAVFDAFMRVESEPRKYNPWTRPSFFHAKDGLRFVIPALPTNLEHLWWYRTRTDSHPELDLFLGNLPDPYDMTLNELTCSIATSICADVERQCANKTIEWWKNDLEELLVYNGSRYARLQMNSRLGLWISPEGNIVTPLGTGGIEPEQPTPGALS